MIFFMSNVAKVKNRQYLPYFIDFSPPSPKKSVEIEKFARS